MTTAKVSAYVIAYNEAEKIQATIESLFWADEIVLIDSHSTDGTTEIAERLGARVVHVEFRGYGDLRNQALNACRHEWILSLDADERCTLAVRDEILTIMNRPDAFDIYFIPRRNFFMGRWIRHSGWYPNYRQPQLFRRGKMKYDQLPVHEGFIALSDKPVGYLNNAIWQYPFKNVGEIMRKADRYSTLGAEKILNKKISFGSALIHGVWSFVKHYIFKCGFLDGWPGFVIAVGNFEGTFYRYMKALERQQADKWHPPTQAPIRRER